MDIIFFKDKPPQVFVSDKERMEIVEWQNLTDNMIISKSKLNIINSKNSITLSE